MSSYNHERHLPDNTGVASGSGLYVWLQRRATQKYGPDLAAEAQAYGIRRYVWLLERLEARGDTELVQEYHRRDKALRSECRQAQRRTSLNAYQEQLRGDQVHERRAYLEKEVAKLQRSIEKAIHKGESE